MSELVKSMVEAMERVVQYTYEHEDGYTCFDFQNISEKLEPHRDQGLY